MKPAWSTASSLLDFSSLFSLFFDREKEARWSSDTLVIFQQTTRRYIPEDRELHNHCCENLKSYIFRIILPTHKIFPVNQYSDLFKIPMLMLTRIVVSVISLCRPVIWYMGAVYSASIFWQWAVDMEAVYSSEMLMLTCHNTQCHSPFLYYSLGVGWDWVHMLRWSRIGLLYQSQMIDDDECGAVGGMRIGKGNRSTRRKLAPVPFCPPQIPHDLCFARTRPPRWEAWAIAQSAIPHKITI
jgi:hypothetical protein